MEGSVTMVTRDKCDNSGGHKNFKECGTSNGGGSGSGTFGVSSHGNGFHGNSNFQDGLMSHGVTSVWPYELF